MSILLAFIMLISSIGVAKIKNYLPYGLLFKEDLCLLDDAFINYYNIDPLLVMSVAYVESKWNPLAINKEDYGLMQVNKYWLTKYGVTVQQALNPFINVQLATSILRYCMDRFDNIILALECYNKGEKMARRSIYKSLYSKRVLTLYNVFRMRRFTW